MKTIEAWRQANIRQYVTISNPHSVMLCRRDEMMALANDNAGLILPDGIGIILAAKILGYKHYGRVTGPNLLLKLCDWGRSHNLRHFFYGGAEGVTDKLVKNLSAKFPHLEIAGSFCPPFRRLTVEEDEKIVAQINASHPDIVWIGLGAPKQEKWMLNHLGKINTTAMIGVGAAFDFHSKNISWAPRWIRVSGLEWAYRFVLEPKRMWRRNLDSPLFLFNILVQKYYMMREKMHKKTKHLDATREKDSFI
ncbi:MAG: WecB/TagA/CpsF family glycosyltransferase [Sedimentisphaerales bacterium]|nr:WecB/TagA/CpsF family glycosyltransferase [Sedimentisphaerales bacterium]